MCCNCCEPFWCEGCDVLCRDECCCYPDECNHEEED